MTYLPSKTDLINKWLDWLRASDLAPGTVRLRRYQLLTFRNRYPNLLAVTEDDIGGWLSRRSWDTETRRSQLAALRSFYGWAYASGRIDQDPSRLVKRIRHSRHLPRPAADSQINRGLLAADARTKLMILLAAEQGLRRAEISCVNSDDIARDLVGWSLLVHGKGRKDRWVPLSESIATALRALPPGWAFPGPAGHLTADHVGVLISRALPKGVTAHMLRHAFATRAYAQTRDLLAVQELLGHASPETTRRYIRLPADALRAAVNAAALAAVDLPGRLAA